MNLSVRQFEHARLVDDVRQAIEGTGVPPSSVMLEVTESVLAKEPDVTIARLEQLSALGIRLAIDDSAPATRRSAACGASRSTS